MEAKQKFSVKARLHSFRYAWQGCRFFFQTQHNARIHLVAAIGAIIAGFYFRISASEWCWILVSISAVFALEIINTAIELLCDRIEPNFDPKIKQIKDLAAAAVLVAAILSVLIAGIVFVPKLM